MTRLFTLPLLLAALAVASPAAPAAAQDGQAFLELGDMAPDVELVGATRYGVLEEPVRLSDFRGEAVVLAFFFRARTPG